MTVKELKAFIDKSLSAGEISRIPRSYLLTIGVINRKLRV